MTSYYIGAVFGFSLILIIIMLIAVIAAKTKAGWVLFFIGAAYQLLPLIGSSKSSGVFNNTLSEKYWIAYFVILAIAALLIVLRRRNMH